MVKRGGSRPGAGRPSKKQLKLLEDNQAVLTELHDLVKDGLRLAGDNLPALIKKELDLALKDYDTVDGMRLSMQSRHFLIDMLVKGVRVSEHDGGQIAAMFTQWRKKTVEEEVIVVEQPMDAPGEGCIIDAESRTLP